MKLQFQRNLNHTVNELWCSDELCHFCFGQLAASCWQFIYLIWIWNWIWFDIWVCIINAVPAKTSWNDEPVMASSWPPPHEGQLVSVFSSSSKEFFRSVFRASVSEKSSIDGWWAVDSLYCFYSFLDSQSGLWFSAANQETNWDHILGDVSGTNSRRFNQCFKSSSEAWQGILEKACISASMYHRSYIAAWQILRMIQCWGFRKE